MIHRFSREEQLIGPQGLAKLRAARVAVFGAGGVGGYTIEALARCGVGSLTIVDGDSVSLTNINRQILALEDTLGRPKAEVARERVLQINPECQVEAKVLFFTPEDGFDFSRFDYVADAIDTVSSKIELILRCREAGVPVISCMGAGNKLDPTAFQVGPLEQSSVCPLARVMRRELKKRQVTGVKAVWSTEEARDFPQGEALETKGTAGRIAPGSVSFVPSVAGLILAGEIVKGLLAGTGGKEHG